MIHVEVTGRGPPLVLVHGWAMHGGIFAPLVPTLAAMRTLHIVDLPGHGFSPGCGASGACAQAQADSATQVLHSWVNTIVAEVPTAPWLGWSLGGLLALEAARRDPARVTGVVAASTTPRFTRSEDWHCAMEPSMFDAFAAGIESNAQATVARFLALEAQGSAHLRDTLRALREQLGTRPPADIHALRAGLRLLGGIDLRTGLPSLRVPTLWIGGRRDRLVPEAAMSAAAGLAPTSDTLILKNSGHAPFLTETDAFANGVLEWLGAQQL